MPRKVVSLGDIATEAGVTRMTVSLALRNQPGRVSDEVRKRVIAAARKLGYRPDARITSWMSQVRASKTREPIPIAWLNADPDENAWHHKKELIPFFEGAQKRCEELGFRLVDDFWLRAPGMTGPRMSQILFSRGIQGVIVTTFDKIFRIRLEWENFAMASFDNSLVAPRLHQASQDYHYNIILAMKHLRRFGYGASACFCRRGPRRVPTTPAPGRWRIFSNRYHRPSASPCFSKSTPLSRGAGLALGCESISQTSSSASIANWFAGWKPKGFGCRATSAWCTRCWRTTARTGPACGPKNVRSARPRRSW